MTDAMNQEQLEPCPCGETPAYVGIIQEHEQSRWARASGSCCGTWEIEFRSNYAKGDALKTLATAAWNSAPRFAGRRLVQAEGGVESCECGDQYAADSFGAGFLAVTGKCPNCLAADQAPTEALQPASPDKEAWRPIETAPKDGKPIIVFHPEGGVCEAFCPGDGFAWHCMDGVNTRIGEKSGKSLPTLTSFLLPPTHWMPLPTPPSEKVQQ